MDSNMVKNTPLVIYKSRYYSIDIYGLVKSGTKKVESFCKYEANIDDVREQEASLDYTPVE